MFNIDFPYDFVDRMICSFRLSKRKRVAVSWQLKVDMRIQMTSTYTTTMRTPQISKKYKCIVNKKVTLSSQYGYTEIDIHLSKAVKISFVIYVALKENTKKQDQKARTQKR